MTPLRLRALVFAFLSVAGLVSAAPPPPHTWTGATDSWTTSSNWTGADVPDQETETATFSSWGDITPTLAAFNDYTLDGLAFSSDAQAYNVTIARNALLTLNGAGIANASSLEQFVTNRGSLTFNASATANSTANAVKIQNWATDNNAVATLTFNDSSTVGTAAIDNWASSDDGQATAETHFYNAGSGSASIYNFSSGTSAGYATIFYHGTASAGTSTIESFSNSDFGYSEVSFQDNATAGSATLGFSAGPVGYNFLSFRDSSSAGSAVINLNSSATANFYGSSTAGSAAINAAEINTGVNFEGNSTAGSATLTAISGIYFNGTSSGGSATIVMNASLYSSLNFTTSSTADGADITLNGAALTFSGSSTAANATITANDSSTVVITESANGANAVFQLNTDSSLDVSLVNHMNLTVGAIGGEGRVYLGNQTLAIGANNLDSTFDGSIEDGGAMGTSGGGIAKIGTGTLTLNGASTYTGTTQIEAGTLVVNGSLASPLTSVNATATLTGSGSLGALTVATGGTLAPGNSPGTFFAGDTTFAPGGTFELEIANTSGAAGTAYDLLSISGTLLLTASPETPFILDVVSLNGLVAGTAAGFDPTADYSLTFLTTTGGITDFSTDAFSILTTRFTNPFTGSWSISLTNSGHDLSLDYSGVSAIPEPSTYAALLGACALGLGIWRKRRFGVR